MQPKCYSTIHTVDLTASSSTCHPLYIPSREWSSLRFLVRWFRQSTSWTWKFRFFQYHFWYDLPNEHLCFELRDLIFAYLSIRDRNKKISKGPLEWQWWRRNREREREREKKKKINKLDHQENENFMFYLRERIKQQLTRQQLLNWMTKIRSDQEERILCH